MRHATIPERRRGRRVDRVRAEAARRAPRTAFHAERQRTANLSEFGDRPGLPAAAELQHAADAAGLPAAGADRRNEHTFRRLAVGRLENLFAELAADVRSDAAGLGAQLCDRRHTGRANVDGSVADGV